MLHAELEILRLANTMKLPQDETTQNQWFYVVPNDFITEIDSTHYEGPFSYDEIVDYVKNYRETVFKGKVNLSEKIDVIELITQTKDTFNGTTIMFPYISSEKTGMWLNCSWKMSPREVLVDLMKYIDELKKQNDETQ